MTCDNVTWSSLAESLFITVFVSVFVYDALTFINVGRIYF